MFSEKYCCSNCFINVYIQRFIADKSVEIGTCFYCKTKETPLISVCDLGGYLCQCISKAYEYLEDGTGAYFDDGMYKSRNGEAATYTIREIMLDEEGVLSDSVINTSIIEDLFESYTSDLESLDFRDVDANKWVVKGDLYGSEQTLICQAWDGFKHITKHYCRFYSPEDFDIRKDSLEKLYPYIEEFISVIPQGLQLYRARLKDDSLKDINILVPNKDLGPPPAHLAKTNRMSPAGIPYLYLSSDIDTTLNECRIPCSEKALVAEYETLQDLQVLDLSAPFFFGSGSVFDPNYDHDNQWLQDFWVSFVHEISQPVNNSKSDHSYEYIATQVVAEYFRFKGLDGICFRSSICDGKNYAFFYGPDPEFTKNAYPYPFGEKFYYYDDLPILSPFTKVFKIGSLQEVQVQRPHYDLLKKISIS